jgi:hypothetical protein
VTKIPPEHTAAKSLEHSFRALGEERARAQRQAPRRWTARVAVAAGVSVLAVAGAATGTKVFTGDGGALRSDDPGPHGRAESDPGYRRLAQASSADVAGGPRWGVRTFRSAIGETCLAVGRVVAGRLGSVRDGQFRELPARTAGLCGALEREHAVLGAHNFVGADIAGGRTVLFGIVDRTITAITVRAASASTPLRIEADGTFILARKGLDAFRGAQLVVDGPGGHRVQPISR